jgi:hypothetical protein
MNRRPITTPPRISTMPRAQTESRLHLERYQIAIEKSRLEKELETLEFRQVEIKARLIQLADQAAVTATLQENLAQKNAAQQQAASTSSQGAIPSHIGAKTFNSESYQTFQLDF